MCPVGRVLRARAAGSLVCDTSGQLLLGPAESMITADGAVRTRYAAAVVVAPAVSRYGRWPMVRQFLRYLES